MNSSRVTESLFGIPSEQQSRAEKIETIKKAVRDDSYVTEERLEAAFQMILKEIQTG